MFTLLTDVGKQNLDSLTDGKISFTSFSVGKYTGNLADLHNVAVSNGNTFAASSLVNYVEGFGSAYFDMYYQFINETRTLIKCFINPEKIKFNFNMVIINALIDDVEFPFIVSYSLETNPKFSTVMNRYGTRYFVIHQLDLTDRAARYNFSELELEKAEFTWFDTNYDTPMATKSQHDQAIITKHVNTPDDYKIFAVESENYFYGVLAQPWSLEDNLQIISIDGEDLQIDGESVFVSINSHNSSVVLNNSIMDKLFVPEPYQFTVLDDYHLIQDDDGKYIVFDPSATNEFLVTVMYDGEPHLITVNDGSLDYLLNVEL